MNIALHGPTTVAEFLAWEERQPLRYEFDGTRPLAIAGGTLRHNRICRNINGALDGRLRGSTCQAFGTDVKIIANNHIRYPDAFVTCSPQNEIGTVAEAPVVVFEVINNSTESIDRVDELPGYLAVPREGETIDLPAILVEIAIDDLYEGFETLTPQDETDHPPPG
ncbi:MAG TPA: Uma2 family endonuclease [Acetobacteraceae bacterium]|jgi:Uma2 family endonuclease|nr:Uma2 family endonuclease [Acetobacteraceae bacterium]